jgi:hypothetical protein
MNTTLSVKEFSMYMRFCSRIRDKILRGMATNEECNEYDKIRLMLQRFTENQYK